MKNIKKSLTNNYIEFVLISSVISFTIAQLFIKNNYFAYIGMTIIAILILKVLDKRIKKPGIKTTEELEEELKKLKDLKEQNEKRQKIISEINNIRGKRNPPQIFGKIGTWITWLCTSPNSPTQGDLLQHKLNREKKGGFN